MYILFFIFRTDCCTNPNPIHLNPIETYIHLRSRWSHGYIPSQAVVDILSGRTSTGEVDHFLPKCALRKSFLPDEQGWSAHSCSHCLLDCLDRRIEHSLQTNMAPAKKNISRAKLYCVRSPHFHQHVQVGPCFQGGYRVVGWYLGCPWGLKKIENKMCLCHSRHLFFTTKHQKQKISRFSQCTMFI